jgi:hypothetical protein
MAQGRSLCFGVDVAVAELAVRPVGAPDPALDNESPDIHSDGVEFYVESNGWQGFVLVPDMDSDRVYIRAVPGTAADPSRLSAGWKRTGDGYRMMVFFDVGRTIHRRDRFLANLVINRMQPGRQRRVGQLVLSGDAGWVYLRGDRESPDGAVLLEIT